MKFGSRASLILLVVLSLVGVGYMGRYVLGLDPFKKFVHFQVMIPTSGGLLEDSPVLANGRVIGRVQGIDVVPGGLRVRGQYDASYRVSDKSTVMIANLSPAGEQFINFSQPDGNPAPYFEDNVVIADPKQIHVSPTVGDVLEQVSGLTDQLDATVLDDVAETIDEILKDVQPQTEEFREFQNQGLRVLDEHGDEISHIFVNVQLALELLSGFTPVFPGLAEKANHLIGPAKALLGAFDDYGQNITPDMFRALERLIPILDRYLGEIINDTHPLLMALKPISAYFRTTYFDPGSTMNTLLKMLPQDGVPRVVLNMAG